MHLVETYLGLHNPISKWPFYVLVETSGSNSNHDEEVSYFRPAHRKGLVLAVDWLQGLLPHCAQGQLPLLHMYTLTWGMTLLIVPQASHKRRQEQSEGMAHLNLSL